MIGAPRAEIRKWDDEGGNVPQLPAVSPVVTRVTSVPPVR